MIRLALLLLACTYLAGCEEDLVATPPVEYPFTLYGVLNPKANTQAVAVYPLQVTLAPIGSESIDAVVRSTDLETGEVHAWADSVLSDGPHGFRHVFFLDFRPEYGRAYRIEADRSDGAQSSVVVNVPVQFDLVINEPAPMVRELRFEGDGFRLINAIVNYTFGEGSMVHTFPIDYSLRLRERDGVWTLSIWLEEYFLPLQRWWLEIFGGVAKDLSIRRVSVDVTVAEEAWRPPVDVPQNPDARPDYIRDIHRYTNPLLDPATLASSPHALRNVEGGFGFVGGGYRQRIDLRVPGTTPD